MTSPSELLSQSKLLLHSITGVSQMDGNGGTKLRQVAIIASEQDKTSHQHCPVSGLGLVEHPALYTLTRLVSLLLPSSLRTLTHKAIRYRNHEHVIQVSRMARSRPQLGRGQHEMAGL